MDQRFYHTSQFAQKASVSVRTLRYYDKVGVLSPTRYTEAGHRLYTDEDLVNLQQILALKFLGFSLEEIKAYLQTEPQRLQAALALQKAMMEEKRARLATVIQAIDETEKLLQANQCEWDAIVKVIQVMQMEQNNDWKQKYFTEEQIQKMQELSRKSYTDVAAQKIQEWGSGWSEQDQERADRQWRAVFTELKRLVQEDKDPAGPEGQALAKQHSELIAQFTHGDADVEAGLKNWWKNFNELPAKEKPMPPLYSKEESEFLEKALKIYKQRHS